MRLEPHHTGHYLLNDLLAVLDNQTLEACSYLLTSEVVLSGVSLGSLYRSNTAFTTSSPSPRDAP